MRKNAIEVHPLLDADHSALQSFSNHRVALFYDYQNRATLGAYVLRALCKYCQVDVYFPQEAEQLSSSRPYDLYLVVDDSTHYVFPVHLHPSAFWVVDTHLSFSFDVVMAMSFDFIFCAQKEGARKLIQHGSSNVFWLPLACDPAVHDAGRLVKCYDIGFVGNFGTGQRRQLLEQMKHRYPDSYIGRAPFDQMAAIYARSRVVANVSARNDVNMRVFEGLCSGSVLLTSRVEGLDDLFAEDRDLFLYSSPAQLWAQLAYLLSPAGQALGEQVAQCGQERVLEQHTYLHRTGALLAAALQKQPAAHHHAGLLALIAQKPELRQRLLATRPNLLLSWLDPGMLFRIIAGKLQGEK